MLRLEDVSVTVGQFSLSADLDVKAATRVAVMGPSGSGKSTLLSLIAGFLRPDRGRILWQGDDLSAVAPGDRPVTILFQDQNLFPHLSVRQNVGLGIDPRLRLSKADLARVDAALLRVGLEGLGERKPGALSGGQHSRVALARALIRARPVLLLDEPFSALGPGLKIEMLDLVAEIADDTGATVLMVSHDPDDARQLCPETIVVDAGRAASPTPTMALLNQPKGALATYLGTRKARH